MVISCWSAGNLYWPDEFRDAHVLVLVHSQDEQGRERHIDEKDRFLGMLRLAIVEVGGRIYHGSISHGQNVFIFR